MPETTRPVAVALLVAAAAVSAGEPPLADPTRPPAYTAPPAAAGAKGRAFRLSAVFLGPGRPRAVINGRTVRVGEQVDGARVIAIERHRVVLARNGGRLTLRLVRTRGLRPRPMQREGEGS